MKAFSHLNRDRLGKSLALEEAYSSSFVEALAVI
jgi:hypothetical protein